MNDHDDASELDPAVPSDGPAGDGLPKPPEEPAIDDTDFDFVEPELGAAEISEDVAESVDLDKVEAEAAAVAAEAERSAQLPASEVISAIPAPALDFKVPEPGVVIDEDSSNTDSAGVDSAEPVLAVPELSEESVADDAASPSAENDAADFLSGGAAEVTAAEATEPAEEASLQDQAAESGTEATPESEPGAPSAKTQDPAAETAAPVAKAPAGAEADAAPTPEAPAGDTPAPRLGHGIDDGSGWRRPETPWQQSGTQWQPRANAWQSPAQVAQGVADAAALAASTPEGEPPASEPFEPTAQGPAGAPAPGDIATPAEAPAPTPDANLPVVPPVPGNPAYPGGPGGPAGPGSASGPASPGESGSKGKLLIVLGVVVVGVVLLGLLIWLVIGLVSGTNTKPTSGAAATVSPVASATGRTTLEAGTVIVAAASPLDWIAGDCLRGFTSAGAAADVVLCSSPHSAQLVGTFEFPKSDTYPGEDALKAKGTDVCNAVQYTDAAKDYKGLKSFKAYPSEATWNELGDRRVDCIVSDPSGNNLNASLTK
ncbi:septum formation family protein [Arthrobacter sp. ERGS1:01]|uniref:septum formation family protein n=1 Tax=Arthrobacter sp. ERGS1:01 TaxID=1704044 RepID=UPI0006B59EF8|nr:septum formation family protein [Arthrobacter sp. ERGS1:01]